MQVTDIRQEKMQLRGHYKSLRDSIPYDEKKAMDEKILRKITQLWSYRDEDVLLTYVSTGSEVDTTALIQYALNDGKIVAVPRCIKNTRNMEFYTIKSLDDLELGAFGVMEPIKDTCKKLDDLSKGLCIVPALTFDKSGYRLGYGKGYYDRFLNNFDGRIIGVCYSFCLCGELPRGRFDRKVSSIVTEKRVVLSN